MSAILKAPFPYFGGKRRVAAEVWRAFGPGINNYVEPFFGSGAVLLGRPGGAGKIETANDRDRMVSNFWRAVTLAPEEVAEWCDYPVNEADLHARHKWLVDHLRADTTFSTRIHADPDYYDTQIAGWWVWGICQWIGGGWCVEPNNHKAPKLDGIGKGVHSDAAHAKARNVGTRSRPKLDGRHVGMGVHSDYAHRPKNRTGENPSEQAKIPHLSDQGRGIHSQQLPKLGVFDGCDALGGVHAPRLARKRSTWNERLWLDRRPAISSAGQGVHLPGLGNDRGIHGVSAAPCIDWFRALQARLRRVRFACGDWQRVLGESVLGKGKNVGGRRPCAVFLDPPYSHEFRDAGLYAEDSAGLSDLVREWALEHGDDPELRIALCGYAGEHEMPDSWTELAWKAARGYASDANENRELERIWFSPHCLPVEQQRSLFA